VNFDEPDEIDKLDKNSLEKVKKSRDLKK